MSGDRLLLDVPRLLQPDEESCGPTCVAQVMHHYGEPHPIPDLLKRVRWNPYGGTLAVYLGLLALELGMKARLHPLSVRVFDPTWWELPRTALIDKLKAREDRLDEPGEGRILRAWSEFLEGGGSVEFGELTSRRLVSILSRRRPLICGLNSTWLYREARHTPDNQPDDIAGAPVGHFVVLCGYTSGGRRFYVNDPYPHVPKGGTGHYPVASERLINAVLLGDITRDAVLLEIWPSTP